MEKRLKKLTILQIRTVYCKMMKTKQTKLKKKDIISKLLKPLKRKYKMESWNVEKQYLPESVAEKIHEYYVPEMTGRSMVNRAASNPFNLSNDDPRKHLLLKTYLKHLKDAQRTLNKFDKYNMKAIEKKYGLYSNQLSTPRLFIVALVINKKLFEKKNRTVLENIFDVMSINSKRNAGYKYSIHDIFAEAISLCYLTVND